MHLWVLFARLKRRFLSSFYSIHDFENGYNSRTSVRTK